MSVQCVLARGGKRCYNRCEFEAEHSAEMRPSMSQALLPILTKLVKKGTPVSLFSDREDVGCFGVGFLLQADDRWITLSCLDEEGRYCGLRVIATELVYNLQYDDSYTASVYRQWLFRVYNDGTKRPPADRTSCGLSLDDMLTLSKKTHSLLQFEFFDSGDWDTAGWLKDREGDALTLILADDKDVPDGMSVIDLGSVTRIDVVLPEEVLLCYELVSAESAK